MSSATRQELPRNGRRLFELTYSAQFTRRANAPAGSAGDWVRTAEIYVEFPRGARGPSFFCFEIRETHRLGAEAPEAILRLIDSVIDGFRAETAKIAAEVVPLTRPGIPASPVHSAVRFLTWPGGRHGMPPGVD